MERSFLEVSRLAVRFGANVPVLNGVELKVRQGEYVAVIGHSGCGKSTLLNVVAGLLPATSGGVILEGREVDEPGPDRAVIATGSDAVRLPIPGAALHGVFLYRSMVPCTGPRSSRPPRASTRWSRPTLIPSASSPS